MSEARSLPETRILRHGASWLRGFKLSRALAGLRVRPQSDAPVRGLVKSDSDLELPPPLPPAPSGWPPRPIRSGARTVTGAASIVSKLGWGPGDGTGPCDSELAESILQVHLEKRNPAAVPYPDLYQDNSG